MKTIFFMTAALFALGYAVWACWTHHRDVAVLRQRRAILNELTERMIIDLILEPVRDPKPPPLDTQAHP